MDNQSITGVKAITLLFKDDPNPPKASEIMAFKKACSNDEWQTYCREALEIYERGK